MSHYSRTHKVDAIIVRRRNFFEKDRLLTLFSRERGKVEVIAKGARRPGAKLSPFSDIGTVGTFHLYSGRGLPIVREITPLFLPEGVVGKYQKTKKLSFLYKVIDKLYQESQPHPKTYRALEFATRDICWRDSQLIFLALLLHIVEDLGLKPELFGCVHCGKKVTTATGIIFSPATGLCHSACYTEAGEKITAKEIKLMRLALILPLEKIASLKAEGAVFDRVFLLVRDYFRWHFGEILPDEYL